MVDCHFLFVVVATVSKTIKLLEYTALSEMMQLYKNISFTQQGKK